MSTQTFIATHLRESVFRKYESYVASMVEQWPVESAHKPFLTESPVTFIAGFRNAVLSLRTFNWQTSIDAVKLRSMTGTYLIRPEKDGLVWVRARTKVAPPRAVIETFSVGNGDSSHLVPWKDPTQDELTALCLLIHHSRLVGPFTISGEVGAELTESLLAEYNVGIVFDAEKKQTIIT